MIVFSAVLGFVTPNLIMENLPGLGFWDFILAFFVFFLSIPLHVILHELGHVLGGLLSGYRFIMFRVFSTVWIKTDQGISKRKQHIPGILGQALMAPPAGEKQPPFLLYHASGLLMNFLTALFLIWMGRIVSSQSLAFALYVSALAALLLFITNLVPKKPNDGYNILQFYKNPEALAETTNVLNLYSGMITGESFTALQRYIDLDKVDTIENPNAVTLYTAQAAAYLEQYEFERARDIYEMLWHNREHLLEPHKPEVFFTYLFILLLTDPFHEDVAKIQDTAIYKNYQKMKSVDRFKVSAAEALYLSGDSAKARELLEEGEKRLDSSPTLSEENLERQLYDYLKQNIQQFEKEHQLPD